MNSNSCHSLLLQVKTKTVSMPNRLLRAQAECCGCCSPKHVYEPKQCRSDIFALLVAGTGGEECMQRCGLNFTEVRTFVMTGG